MTVYMLRHAESEYNAGDITKYDAKLTQKGQEQARRIRKKHFHVVLCSTLTRARQTLQLSAITYDTLLLCEDLREFRNAVCDFFPAEVNAGKNRESLEEFDRRMKRMRKQIKEVSHKLNRHQKILLVAHHVTFRGLTHGKLQLDNAQMAKYTMRIK